MDFNNFNFGEIKMKSQNIEILNYLKKGNKLTAMDALHKFSCFRLASRINDLRKEGNNIISNFKKIKNAQGKNVYVAEYSLWMK